MSSTGSRTEASKEPSTHLLRLCRPRRLQRIALQERMFGIPHWSSVSVNVSSKRASPSPAALNATKASQASASPKFRNDSFLPAILLTIDSVLRQASFASSPRAPSRPNSLNDARIRSSPSRSNLAARTASFEAPAAYLPALAALKAATSRLDQTSAPHQASSGCWVLATAQRQDLAPLAAPAIPCLGKGQQCNANPQDVRRRPCRPVSPF